MSLSALNSPSLGGSLKILFTSARRPVLGQKAPTPRGGRERSLYTVSRPVILTHPPPPRLPRPRRHARRSARASRPAGTPPSPVREDKNSAKAVLVCGIIMSYERNACQPSKLMKEFTLGVKDVKNNLLSHPNRFPSDYPIPIHVECGSTLFKINCLELRNYFSNCPVATRQNDGDEMCFDVSHPQC